MSEPILKAEHLGITFGGLKAVSDFNMTINSGELVGLIGPNGAGKTTVFNLLTGVYQPTEGEFFLDGERMNGKKTYQVVRAGIARTFQNIRLFGQMTVEENVLVAFNESFSYHMGGAIFRTPKFWKQEREMHAKAIDLLKIFGLEGLAETEAANLPYGAQRKLEIARALATGMKLLLLDEPAAGLSQPAFRRPAAARRHRPRAGDRSEAAVARRAGGRHEPDGDRGPAQLHQHHPRPLRHRHPVDRA